MKKVFVLSVAVLLSFLFASMSDAELKKGSVGAGGVKRFTFISDHTGQAQLTLIFDNSGSDIDLAAGIVSNGQASLIGTDVSSMKNYAHVECGVVAGLPVVVLVDSYKGASPFRLFVTTATDEGTYTATKEFVEAQEGNNAVYSALENQLNTIQKAKK